MTVSGVSSVPSVISCSKTTVSSHQDKAERVHATPQACIGKGIPGKGIHHNSCTLQYPFLCPSFLCHHDGHGPRNISGLYGKGIPGKGIHHNSCTLQVPFPCPSFLCHHDGHGPRNTSGLLWQKNPGQKHAPQQLHPGGSIPLPLIPLP